jgi:O-antigen/teichoic acid export membrane protein
LRSRTFWFLLNRIVGNGAGFALTAVLTRIVNIEQAAAFLAAFAFASIFEPLFSSSVYAYVSRLVTAAPEDQQKLVLRSCYIAMQIAAILLILPFALFLLFTDGALQAAFFVSIMFTPLTLFSIPFRTRDDYIFYLATSVIVALCTALLRIGILLGTGDLVLTALLMGMNPLITGVIYIWRAGIPISGRPWIITDTLRTLMQQSASLLAAMFLALVAWRSPILFAEWQLGPVEVVHIALAMQVVTGLCIVPNSLGESLFGPLSASLGDDAKFRNLLKVGSSTAWICVAGAVIGVALFGDPVMRAVYGPKAEGAAVLCSALSCLCLVGGLERLVNMTANLKGEPIERVACWIGVLCAQAVGFSLIFLWKSPMVIAISTPISMLIGFAVIPFFLPVLRSYAPSIVLGVRELLTSPRFARSMITLMLRAKTT